MRRSRKLTLERLLYVMNYDPTTGIFVANLTNRRRKAGARSDRLVESGYRLVCIDGKEYRAHRLAWLYVHGCWPTGEIDHINNIRTDNRIANLREATSIENNRNIKIRSNNTSGYKGVWYSKRRKKWRARITVDWRDIELGFYDSAEAAYAAYCAAVIKYHGEFARAA